MYILNNVFVNICLTENARDNPVYNEAGINSTADFCHQLIWMWWQRVPEKPAEEDIKRQSLGVGLFDSLCQHHCWMGFISKGNHLG